ncbi:hypothetical protein JCM3774_006744, partial [Rhodotorula dairenensis]
PARAAADNASVASMRADIEYAQPKHEASHSVSQTTTTAVQPSSSAATNSSTIWSLPPRPEAPTPPSALSASGTFGAHGRSASLGEAAFSTPKPTSPASPNRTGKGHQRGASFTARPLALVSASSSSSSAVPVSVSNPSAGPPKIELRRNWSIGTWIPQLNRAGDDLEDEAANRAGSGAAAPAAG